MFKPFDTSSFCNFKSTHTACCSDRFPGVTCLFLQKGYVAGTNKLINNYKFVKGHRLIDESLCF